MLLYTRKAPPKVPKKRSRAANIGCYKRLYILKKKCNEVRPRCDRCTDRGLQCQYEAVKPRKRRRASSAESALSHESGSPGSDREQWPRQYPQSLSIITNKDVENVQNKWEEKTQYPLSAISEHSSFTWGSFYENDDEVEEIPREDLYVNSPPAGTLVRTQSQYPDLAMIAPSPVASPLLAFSSPLVQRGNSSIVHGHLKGAMTIMSSRHEEQTPTSIFLERAFRFYDVITALSLGTPPNSTTQPTTSPFSFPSVPDDENKDSQLNSVDTLLGLSTELWPIIHRLSHLLSYKSSLQSAIEDGLLSKASVLRTELESTSKAIEMALTNWKPSFVAKGPSSPKENEAEDTSSKYDIDPQEARMQTILNNAEAYRHSAFVYLYRTIHSHPRSHPVVQKHTKLSLIACANVVGLAEMCNDGPMSALLWPLFVAACEAETESDRELATKAFGKTERRQGMRNIMRAWEVVQEVWRRADDGTYEDGDWRGICESRGWNIVLG
ncbi:hypothetical protein SS1G_00392 [Sclerotinia sclerotiorum 1980 UF-70]|uniref:Zn(2)-C6 fungal-type domain-containing protein n=1 Tax=Sclerotinia sclerotiorum (strain ATCC 18683 / 1980 / Ss-1) TaxID=665079 RepID=A7E520_SCLS1|nr:hypothetical protein SS1G_00392 [Sclerotinia sclerotiorum 1980 UF-70]EDN90992.1 hypothetical protein SS1G_00392 [Sclerotinia sclerotiorum 1980 UF-70]